MVTPYSTGQDKHTLDAALRLSEARFKAAIAAVAGIVWTNDASGRMRGEQPGWSQLTGQNQDEYTDFGWANAVHPDDAAATVEAWNAAVADKRPFMFEHRVKTAHGEWRLFSIRAIPIFSPEGEIEEWVGVHTDVTDDRRQQEELRRLAAELSESNQRKSQFLAVLAHELRNPLAPILTGLDIIGMSYNNPATLQRTREMMVRQVSHMVHLIDDLLDIARITSGKVELRREMVSLGGIFSNAIEASTPILQTNGHALATLLPDEEMFIFADAVRITQVIVNLLTNAAKYTPKGGAIGLSAHHHGQTVSIQVKDNGVGIPADAVDSIFDMFSQVSRNLEWAQGGMGIGLSIVKQLVELHGGAVAVSSAGANAGSTFTVTLPLASPAHASDITALPVNHDQTQALRTLKVLIADDNADAANTLSDLLQLLGHEVVVANDGKEALLRTREIKPDLLFLDIGMPFLTGFEVARAIRSNPVYDDMILVALTGWGAVEDRQRSAEAGFNYHLTKPIHLAAVDNLLKSVVTGRGSIDLSKG